MPKINPRRTKFKGIRKESADLRGWFRPEELRATDAAEKRFEQAKRRHESAHRIITGTSTSTTSS